MFVILGATGHVGFATTQALIERGEDVIAMTRDASKAKRLEALGAQIAECDLYDVEATRKVFARGKRLFLLNPPAAPDTDTDAVEKKTASLLLDAVDGSGVEKIVAQSTYGAQDGDRLGDLNTLYALEQGLRAQSIPHSVIRAAYFLSNWDVMLEPAREEGVLPTMYPADLKIPMVAPVDIGRVAAELLLGPVEESHVHFVEGPERYSSGDVAAAFANALGRPVHPVVTPREDWEATYRALGFSEPAARSYARMTAISVDGAFDIPHDPTRGSVRLQEYIDDLVRRR